MPQIEGFYTSISGTILILSRKLILSAELLLKYKQIDPLATACILILLIISYLEQLISVKRHLLPSLFKCTP